MRTRTLIIVAAALVALSALLLVLATQTGLIDGLVTWLGERAALAIAIALLVVMLGIALTALIYGIRQDDMRRPQRRGRRARR